MSGHAKMPPASHQVSVTPLKLLIQQIHPHVRVERDSGMCIARGLYELQHVYDDASFKVIGSLRPAAIKFANHLLTLDNVLHCALGMQR